MGVVAIIVKQPPLLNEICLSGTIILRPKETQHFLITIRIPLGLILLEKIGFIKENNSKKYITRV